MAQSGSFGRRPAPQSAARPLAQKRPMQSSDGLFAKAQAEAAAAAHAAMLPPTTGDKALDIELAEWKATRKNAFKLPWRQLSLMASLCFGIASFVLPESINDAVNWALYALMGISFVVGVTGKKKAKA